MAMTLHSMKRMLWSAISAYSTCMTCAMKVEELLTRFVEAPLLESWAQLKQLWSSLAIGKQAGSEHRARWAHTGILLVAGFFMRGCWL